MQLTIAIILLAGSALAVPNPLLPASSGVASDGSDVSAPTGPSSPPPAGAALGGPPAPGLPGPGSPGPCAPPPSPLDPSQADLSSPDPQQVDSAVLPDSSGSDSSLVARADIVYDPRGFFGDIKHAGKKIGSGVKHAGEKVGSGIKHAGHKVGSGVKNVGNKVDGALVIDGCHVVKCGIALGPTEASCVAAAVEEGLNPVADAGCFASATNDVVNKPSACNGCPLSGLSAVKKITG